MSIIIKFTQDKFSIQEESYYRGRCSYGTWYLRRAAVRASTGEHEAVELRDGGKAYLGRSFKCSENVNTIIAEEL
jgi:hypothetical protein